jgi:uncharacterized protein (DUF1778 family)
MPAVASKPAISRARRDTTINLRIPAQTRDLFDAAAEAVGKTRTQFVVDSARAQAMDILLNQRIFRLDDAGFAAFCSALDKPAAPSRKLRQLFAKQAPWET